MIIIIIQFHHQPQLTYSDRFIPTRAASARLEFSALDRDIVTNEVLRATSDREDFNPAYNALLRSELLGSPLKPGLLSPDKSTALEQLRAGAGGASTSLAAATAATLGPSPSGKLFRYIAGDELAPVGGPSAQSPFMMSPIGEDERAGPSLASPKKAARKIARAPFKVLDAPSLTDDFYLNVIDWSSQNVMAVGLGSCVYMWSACTSKVTKLCDLSPSDNVCSVNWSQRGSYLAIGTNSGKLQIWDVTKVKLLRTMDGHRARVGCLSWGGSLLASGSRDRSILQRDVRVAEHYVQKLPGHKAEVCGLKWSLDDRQLASGGNDNVIHVWSPHSLLPQHRFADHTAAVKALAWSPHQHGLLASGGGTADRCIRFWNTTNGTALNSVDTGSQVCCLAWSKNVNELVSTHGYSQNQVVVWKYPSMSKVATLTGHTMRVLYLAVSPDGQTVVTGAGDETLRFWNVFPGPKTQGADSSVSSMTRTVMR